MSQEANIIDNGLAPGGPEQSRRATNAARDSNNISRLQGLTQEISSNMSGSII